MSVDILATLVTGLFAGGAAFISVVEHPARMGEGAAFAVAEFRPSFSRAHYIMASLAVLGFVLGGLAWMQGMGAIWLIGGLIMVANGPWTFALIYPINRQLMDPNLDVSSPRAKTLIERWGYFHWARTLFGLTGFVLFAMGLTQRSL